jgi:hypothetical protein
LELVYRAATGKELKDYIIESLTGFTHERARAATGKELKAIWDSARRHTLDIVQQLGKN